jgi:hypothetical protein
MAKLIGNAPNQVPTNADLGKMAFEDKVSVANLNATGTKDATTFLRGDNTFASAGVNTPMVYAQGNSATSCADNTTTKITLDNELINTEGLFANSRFTVTSGYEGKYLIIFQLSFNHTATSLMINPSIKVNNTTVAYGQDFSAKSANHTMTVRTSIITDLSVNDYVEFFGRQDSGSTKTNNSGIYTNASITKLID